jgi:hypothetical protein
MGTSFGPTVKKMVAASENSIAGKLASKAESNVQDGRAPLLAGEAVENSAVGIGIKKRDTLFGN